MPDEPTDFVDGIVTIAGNGDLYSQSGIAIHIYRCNRDMTDRFFYNADGEMLIVNYRDGSVLRVSPDFAVVPRAPRMTAVAAGDRVTLAWDQGTPGVTSVAYEIERVRSGAVTERLSAERSPVTIDWSEGDCLRVRGRGRAGFRGPPSAEACRP